MRNRLSVLGRIIGIVILLVVLVVIVAVAAYASDYAVEGTVTQRQCSLTPPSITVDTNLFGARAVEVTAQECGILSEGNFVVYRIRSGHTTVYETQGGACLYDSQTGYRCGASVGGGPLL